MYDTIVHPTDGSSCADRALEHATSLADQYDADLHVVYAVAEPSAPPTPNPALVVDELKESGEEVVQRKAETARSEGLDDVTTHVEIGRVYDQILGLVDAEDADLIVMGTHGRSGLQRMLMGSTAENVLRHASTPVLAVEPEPDGGETE